MSMTCLDTFIGTTGVFTSLAAAILWFLASLIKVPDNIDTFINVLQKIGRLNAYGAISACVAAVCAAYAFSRSIGFI